MPAPTLVVYKDAYALNAAAFRDLAQITVATGDVIAIVVQTESYSTTGSGGAGGSVAKNAGTATTGAFTLQREGGTANHCGNTLFTGTVTAGGTL